MQALIVHPGWVLRDWLNMMQIDAREHFCTRRLVRRIVNASEVRTCVKDCLHYTSGLFACAVLFLDPTNAGATTQSVLGVTVMLREIVLVPFYSHRFFLPCLKAVQHRARRFCDYQGDKHKLAKHNCMLSFCNILCKVGCSKLLVGALSDCEPPCLAVE